MFGTIIRKVKPTGIRKLSDHTPHVQLDTYLTSMENRLAASQKELKADLLAFQKESQARLEATQKELQARLEATHKELAASQKELKTEFTTELKNSQRTFKSDMGHFLNVFAYKIVALAVGSGTAAFAGMDYLGVSIHFPWKKHDTAALGGSS